MITIDMIDERINHSEKQENQGNRPRAGFLGLGWIVFGLKLVLGKREDLTDNFQDEILHRNGRKEIRNLDTHLWLEKPRGK